MNATNTGAENRLAVSEPAGREPMHVALGSDEAYFPGFACTILSIATASEGPIVFHILDGGIADASWSLLEQKLASLAEEFSIIRHRISLGAFEGFPPGCSGGAMTYARLLMETLIQQEEIIYVDSDLLCLRNLRDLWEEPMGDDLVAACRDWAIMVRSKDPVFKLTEEEGRERYFNAGFIKVNLRLWRQESVQKQCLELLRDFGAQCFWADQSALNWVCAGRVKYLDQSWNRSCYDAFTLRDFTGDGMNIHYISKQKPWMIYDFRTIANVVWRLYWQKWFPGFGARRGLSGVIERRRYDFLVYLLNGFGSPIIGAIDLVRGCLGRLSPNAKIEGLREWLERRKASIEIVKWAWKSSASLCAVRGGARQT